MRTADTQDRELLAARLSVPVPGRCGQHECVKGSARDPDDETRRCIFCENYHLNLRADTCLTCLATPHLFRFKAEKYVAESDWYQYMLAQRASK